MIDLFWKTIGDVFRKQVFTGSFQRPVEAIWKAQEDLAADSLQYARYLKDARSIFSCPPYAPAGSFPIDPALVDDDKIDVRLIDIKKESNWLWIFWTNDNGVISEEGHFEFRQHSKGYSSANVFNMESDGRIIKLGGTGTEEVLPVNKKIIGEAFDRNTPLNQGKRWRQDTGKSIAKRQRGFFFDVDGSDWVTLYDENYISGVDNWRITYRFEITNWDSFPNLQNAKRHISLQSIGDTGEDFEITLEQDYQKGLIAKMGPVGGANLKTTPVPSDWLNTIENADSSAGLPIELEMRYDASNSIMSGSIHFDDDKVELQQAIDIQPGRRKHVFGVYNSHNTVKGYLKYVVGKDGHFWRQPDINQGSISPSFPYQYDIQDDIIRADHFRIRPWDFAPPSNIEPKEKNIFDVEVDQGWEGYTPEAVRIEKDGEWWLAEKQDEDTYEIKWSSSPNKSLPSRARLHPWYLKENEIDIPQAGVLATKYPIPIDDTTWLEGTELRTVNLYERFGKVLEAANRTDSPTYLQNLRGMYMGIHRRPTPQKLKQAIEVFLELPYTPEGGTLDEIRKGAETDEVVVGNEVFEIDAYWRQQGLLRREGDVVPQNGTVAEGVEVYDWHMRELPEYLSEWEKWGTFMVEIPGGIGLALNDLSMLQTLIRKAKKHTKTYKIEFQADIDEETTLGENLGPSQTPNSSEDMVFPDGPSVAAHPDSKHYPDGTVQRQQNEDLTLGEHEMLDRGLSLGSLNLHKPRPGWRTIGDATLADTYQNNYSIPRGEFRWYDTHDIKRDLTQTEKDFHFQRPGLRMGKLVGEMDASNKRMLTPRHPTDIVNVYQYSNFSAIEYEPSILFMIDSSSGAQTAWNNYGQAAFDYIADNYGDTEQFGGTDMYSKVVTFRDGQVIDLLSYGNNSSFDLKSSWDSLTFTGNRPLGLATQEIVDMGFHKDDPLRDHLVFMFATGGNDDSIDAAVKADSARNARNNIQIVGADTTASILDDVDDNTAYDATSQSDVQTAFDNMWNAKRERRDSLIEWYYRSNFFATSEEQNGVDIRAYDDIVSCGNNGTINQSTDYGNTWNDISVSETEDFYSTSNDWFVGDNSTVWKSGSSTSISALTQTWHFRRITFYDSDNGAISGFNSGDGVLVTTTDGGNSWTENIYTGEEFHNHQQDSAGTYWIATGSSGKIFKYDGSFQKVFEGASEINAIAVKNHGPVHIMLAAGDANIYRSTDKGGSWEKISAPNSDPINDVAWIDDWRAIFTDDFGGTYLSYDRGKTWKQAPATALAVGKRIATEPPWYQIIAGKDEALRFRKGFPA